jgi:hypothetical protein
LNSVLYNKLKTTGGNMKKLKVQQVSNEKKDDEEEVRLVPNSCSLAYPFCVRHSLEEGYYQCSNFVGNSEMAYCKKQ